MEGPTGRITTAATLLRRAALRVERGWTTQAQARDGDGQAVYPHAPTARSWCGRGAMIAEAPGFPFRPTRALDVAQEIIDTIQQDRGEAAFTNWNDEPGRTAAQVAARLRLAAEFADEVGA